MVKVIQQSVSERMKEYSKKQLNSVSIEESTIQVPIDQQTTYSQTIQTHNAVSVGASSWSDGVWVDCNGFDKIGITVKNDAGTSNSLHVLWSNDGINRQGVDTSVFASDPSSERVGETTVKARYIKLRVINDDANSAHTMSTWAYLKA
jgi:hypothetical protein